jgi:hypothetical protein
MIDQVALMTQEIPAEDGARRRIAAAKAHRSDFGVACECGLGRRDPDSIAALLDLHRDAALSTAKGLA